MKGEQEFVRGAGVQGESPAREKLRKPSVQLEGMGGLDQSAKVTQLRMERPVF